MSSIQSTATSVVPPIFADPDLASAPAPKVGHPEAPPVLASDAAAAEDRLGRAGQAQFLAELLTHRRAETPFCLGIFGAAGSGKSLFVNQVLGAVEGLSAAAEGAGAGPFLPDVMTVRIDASAGADAGDLLARGVFDALAATYPRLAAESMHAGVDPVRAARDAGEALNDARRRLDAERQSLDAMNGREARLTETVLFEAAGSRVDAYARRNRSRIERALRLFGFGSADPVRTYKDLVRETAETDGPLARWGIGLRALWAYQGQTRLLVWAVLLGLVAWGASALQADQASWLGQIRQMGDRAGPVADWAQAHVPWLGPVHTVALVLALVCLAWNLLRAARFVQPIFKGVSLLRLDVEGRRRDLNGLLAHQTRRVDGLAAEVEAAAQLADDAERRAGVHKASGLRHVRLTAGQGGADTGRRDAATAFFASLGAAMRSTPGADAQDIPRLEARDRHAPSRIVVAIDGLEQLPDTAAAGVVRTARRLLGAGFATLVAADRTALAAGFAEADAALAAVHLNRCIQLGYNLGLPGDTDGMPARLARQLIDGRPAPAAGSAAAGRFDPNASALDRPWRTGEAEVVAALARFAGEGPRAVKRYVNLYRVARADPHLRDAPPPVFTALALALALDHQGLPEDLAALRSPGQRDAPRDLSLLREALAAAQTASGEPVELTQAQRGFDVARHYSARG